MYDRERYKEYTWKNWMMLHFILNPGLAFNELVLGQRMPKLSLVDRESDAPYAERSRIPCPHCGTLHDGRVWSGSRGMKNWFGLYCPSCAGVIPCLMNVTTWIILAVTSPLWYWFRKPLYRKWYRAQPGRFGLLELEKPPADYPKEARPWVKMSLGFAFFMFVFNTGFQLLVNGWKGWSYIGFSALIWLIGGFCFGFTMRYVLGRKGKKTDKLKLKNPEADPQVTEEEGWRDEIV